MQLEMTVIITEAPPAITAALYDDSGTVDDNVVVITMGAGATAPTLGVSTIAIKTGQIRDLSGTSADGIYPPATIQ